MMCIRDSYFFAGGALVISSLSIALYTQTTTLMLAHITSTYELGLYSVAVTIGISWNFVNQSIITSVLSKIFKEKDNYKAYKMFTQLNIVVVFISLFAILGFILLGEFIIKFLYGSAYIKSYPLLIIMALSSLFSSLGIVSSRLILRENGYSYISKKTIIVAFFSIPISYFYIKYYGLIGAAYSVATIEFLSATIFNYFYKKGIILKLHYFHFLKSK